MTALVAERQAASASYPGCSDTAADASTRHADALLDAMGEARLEALGSGQADATRAGRTADRARHAFTIALFGMFSIGLLLAMAAGTGLFRSLRSLDAATGEERMSAGLIANAVHATDAADSVQIGQGPEGRSLVLVERLDSGTFETRFYAYDGQVLQEYVTAGATYNPASAVPVVESRTFEVSFDVDSGLLRVTTDAGSTSVALRSVQGGDV